MYKELEQGLGYTFRDRALLENALRHSSYANEKRGGLSSNERLEFLGDSILGFVTADFLYHRFPDSPEGDLTRIRAELVCEGNLARRAATIRLGDFLLLGHGEEAGGAQAVVIIILFHPFWMDHAEVVTRRLIFLIVEVN